MYVFIVVYMYYSGNEVSMLLVAWLMVSFGRCQLARWRAQSTNANRNRTVLCSIRMKLAVVSPLTAHMCVGWLFPTPCACHSVALAHILVHCTFTLHSNETEKSVWCELRRCGCPIRFGHEIKVVLLQSPTIFVQSYIYLSFFDFSFNGLFNQIVDYIE